MLNVFTKWSVCLVHAFLMNYNASATYECFEISSFMLPGSDVGQLWTKFRLHGLVEKFSDAVAVLYSTYKTGGHYLQRTAMLAFREPRS